MPNEHLVLDGDPLADERVTLDLAARADFSPLLNLDECPNRRLIADFTPVEVDEGMETYVLAQLDVRGDAPGKDVALFGRQGRRQATTVTAAPLTGTTPPPCSIERWAASRIRTTRHPAQPFTTSSPLPWMASITLSTSIASASRVSSCGACMSPERYEIISWYSFSTLGSVAIEKPLSYTFSFSLGSISS